MAPTRRTVLQAAVTGLVGLGGCADRGGRRTADPKPTGSVSDPPQERARNPANHDVVTSVPGEESGIARMITEASQADRLAFHSGVPDADRESVRAFLRDTTFGEESICLLERRVEECYRYEVQYLSWEPGAIETQTCRELRPPDARCRADTRVAEAQFIRLPAVVDITVSRRSGGSRGECRGNSREWSVIETNASSAGER